MSKKVLAVVLIALTLCAVCFAAAGCKDEEEFDPSFLYERFMPGDTSSYSNTYTQLDSPKHGNRNRWRDGMITGNGVQGAVIAGSPYSDTIIFQNIHLILPNKNPRSNDAFDTADELETVRQNIVAGKNITDDQPYLDVYDYHHRRRRRARQPRRVSKSKTLMAMAPTQMGAYCRENQGCV